MDKQITGHVLQQLLENQFESKADMARKLGIHLRTIQRVFENIGNEKAGTIALDKAISYCAIHHISLDSINYEFATGETTEIDVSEELANAIAIMARSAILRDRAETRRHVSLERLVETGFQPSNATNAETLAELALDKAALMAAMEQLQPQQRILLRRIYFERTSIATVAFEESVLPATISHRLERIHRKLRKILE